MRWALVCVTVLAVSLAAAAVVLFWHGEAGPGWVFVTVSGFVCLSLGLSVVAAGYRPDARERDTQSPKADG